MATRSSPRKASGAKDKSMRVSSSSSRLFQRSSRLSTSESELRDKIRLWLGTEPCRPRCRTCTHATETTAGEMDGRMDGWTDSHGGASPEAGGERDQRELTEREVSTQRQAASVVFFVVTSLFQMQSARCVLTLFCQPAAATAIGSRRPHIRPSIHDTPSRRRPPRSNRGSTRWQLKHQREREREEDDHPVKQVRLWRKEPRRGQIWGGLVFFFLKPFRWRRP